MNTLLRCVAIALASAAGFACSEPENLQVEDEVEAAANDSTPSDHVLEYMNSLNATRDHASVAQRHSIAILRQNPEASVRAAVELYQAARGEDRHQRWLLVHTIGSIGSQDAAQALKSILLERDASPAAALRHTPANIHDTQREQEGMIALRAMAGLAQMAATNMPSAVEGLEAALESDDVGIRSTAAFHLLETAGQRGLTKAVVQARLEELLAKNDHWMLAMRALDPNDSSWHPRPELIDQPRAADH